MGEAPTEELAPCGAVGDAAEKAGGGSLAPNLGRLINKYEHTYICININININI